MRRTGPVVLAVAVIAVAGCGDSAELPREVVAKDPAVAFAPLVRLDRGERSWPMSAVYFLDHSGLEWVGGPCGYERDVTESGTSRNRAKSATEAAGLPPVLDNSRLGHGDDVYRVRPTRSDCGRPRPEVFRSDQRTTPFDVEDRPVGLGGDEGFSLDLDEDAQPGRLRLARDGLLAGVPIYHALAAEGRASVRIAYWMLFGRESLRRRASDGSRWREGDWERVDVLARRGSRDGVYLPVAFEYRVDGEPRRVGWDDVEHGGPAGTHPVVHLERDRHTPSPTATCERCVDWPTWRAIRDVRAETWWGYGGGWGAFVKDEPAQSGRSGPSPYVVNAPPPGR